MTKRKESLVGYVQKDWELKNFTESTDGYLICPFPLQILNKKVKITIEEI